MSDPLEFTPKESAQGLVVVTTADGQRYEVRLAMVVTAVSDTGHRNPLDGLPMFQITTQIVSQITRKTDG